MKLRLSNAGALSAFFIFGHRGSIFTLIYGRSTVAPQLARALAKSHQGRIKSESCRS